MDSIQFFPPPYRDESTSNEHCRACLVKVDTDCVSIHEIYPWNETEMISIQGIIEFLINRKLTKEYPNKICSTCSAGINAILQFRQQCLAVDNKLNEIAEPMIVEQQSYSCIKTEHEGESSPQNQNTTIGRRSARISTKKLKNEIVFIEEESLDIEVTSIKKEEKETKNVNLSEESEVDEPEFEFKKPKRPSKPAEETDETSKLTYLCSECGLIFENYNEYYRHISLTHRKTEKKRKRFYCEFCPKSYDSRKVLKNHINIHTKEIVYICDMCGRQLLSKDNLRLHFKYHMTNKAYKCEQCGYQCVSPSILKGHIRRVHTPLAVACTYENCSATFSSEHKLNIHLRLHSTNFAFVCDICKKAFVNKARLNEHKRIHEKIDMVDCPHCPKTLSSVRRLRYHLKAYHDGADLVVNPKRRPPKKDISSQMTCSNV